MRLRSRRRGKAEDHCRENPFTYNYAAQKWNPSLTSRMLIRSSEARPFHGELAICTWSSRALFGVDLVRASAKQSFVQGLIADHDVLGLEEVRGSYEFTKNFDSKLRHSHRCFWSFLENHGAGGVGIIVKLTFMANFASVVQEVLIRAVYPSTALATWGPCCSWLCTSSQPGRTCKKLPSCRRFAGKPTPRTSAWCTSLVTSTLMRLTISVTISTLAHTRQVTTGLGDYGMRASQK